MSDRGSGGVSAATGAAPGCRLVFASVRILLRAGETLRADGFDVLVVPRFVRGCGVLLQVESHTAVMAVAALARAGIVPTEVLGHGAGKEEAHEQAP